MEASGVVEIGAHTHTHCDMSGDPVRFENDLRECMQSLEAGMGSPRRLFAFPFGDPALGYVNNGLMKAARNAGARCALTTETQLIQPGDSPFGWGRLEVVEQDTGATLAAKLGGWYNWMRQVRNLAHTVAPW